jgi:hypothetical protein
MCTILPSFDTEYAVVSSAVSAKAVTECLRSQVGHQQNWCRGHDGGGCLYLTSWHGEATSNMVRHSAPVALGQAAVHAGTGVVWPLSQVRQQDAMRDVPLQLAHRLHDTARLIA